MKKYINASLISFSLLSLSPTSVQASSLPNLEITNKDFSIAYTAKEYKNRSMIMGLKKMVL